MSVSNLLRALRRRFLAAGLVAVAATLSLTCSGNAPTGATVYVVTYSLNATSQVAFDSVQFEDATGNLVHVTSPFPGWSTGFAAAIGDHVQASAWGRTLADSQSASLLLTLSAHGNSNIADSSTATNAVPGSFVLAIPRLEVK